MGIGASIVLIAIGAILTWAVEFEVAGIELNTVGVILMIVGLIGAVASAFYMRRGTVVTERREPMAPRSH